MPKFSIVNQICAVQIKITKEQNTTPVLLNQAIPVFFREIEFIKV